MNASDSRVRRDVADLARLMPVPAERDLPTGRRHVLKEHLMTELRTTDASARQRASRTPVSRPALAITAGAIALAAVAVSATVVALTGHSAPKLRIAHGGPVTAAQLLSKIARVASEQPAPRVRDSQFWYVESRVAFESCTFPAQAGKPSCVMEKPHKRQIWLSVSNLCRPGLLRESSQDTKLGGGSQCPDRGSLNDPTYRLLQTLPTNPRSMLHLIYRIERGHGQSKVQEAFTTIGDLLRESIAPPKVTAALYRAAALIPGVRVVQHARDAIGRPGIAVAFTFRGTTTEWIFGRSTLRWLGELELARGHITGESATLVRGFVNRPGELP